MSRRASKPGSQRYDLDEMQPGSFVINNPLVRSLLKGEGEAKGAFFVLGTWRREGLIARIRERGFSVRTLAERLEELPPLPPPLPLGEQLSFAVGEDRSTYSRFDAAALHWQPITAEGELHLREGEVLRRRRGRGSANYHQVVGQRGQARLLPLGETEGLLLAYAQATADALRSLPVQRLPEGYLLPKPATLPPPYRDLLLLLGSNHAGGLLIAEKNWPLTHKIYQRLRLQLALSKT